LLTGIHWLDYEQNNPFYEKDPFNDKTDRHLATVSLKPKRVVYGTVDNNLDQNNFKNLEAKEHNASMSSLPRIIEAKSEGEIRKTNFFLNSEADSIQSVYNIKVELSEISNRMMENGFPIESLTEIVKVPLYDVKNYKLYLG
jgi:hypothetical protein